jgi:hypothetical protein
MSNALFLPPVTCGTSTPTTTFSSEMKILLLLALHSVVAFQLPRLTTRLCVARQSSAASEEFSEWEQEELELFQVSQKVHHAIVIVTPSTWCLYVYEYLQHTWQ